MKNSSSTRKSTNRAWCMRCLYLDQKRNPVCSEYSRRPEKGEGHLRWRVTFKTPWTFRTDSMARSSC